MDPPPSVPTVTTAITRTPALPTATTDLIGSQMASSSVPVPGSMAITAAGSTAVLATTDEATSGVVGLSDARRHLAASQAVDFTAVEPRSAFTAAVHSMVAAGGRP